MVSECDGQPTVQVEPSAVNRMVTACKQICHKCFTPHVDLHSSEPQSSTVSPVPDPNAWDIDALNINWSSLTAYAYPPTALLHRVIQKIRRCNSLIIVIPQAGQGCPGFGT